MLRYSVQPKQNVHETISTLICAFSPSRLPLFSFIVLYLKRKCWSQTTKLISELTNDWVVTCSLRNTVIEDLTDNVVFLAVSKLMQPETWSYWVLPNCSGCLRVKISTGTCFIRRVAIYHFFRKVASLCGYETVNSWISLYSGERWVVFHSRITVPSPKKSIFSSNSNQRLIPLPKINNKVDILLITNSKTAD